ncbi:MAG: hypothetical protein PHV57_05105 [Methanomicrobiaceae archaeon]|nr:hypothetical protein [Methanomicrobiaceae archaeon]
MERPPPNERVLLEAMHVLVKSQEFRATLTDVRILLADAGKDSSSPPRMIPRTRILNAEAGETGAGEPTLSLTVRSSRGEPRTLILVFSQRPGEERSRERDAWLEAIKGGDDIAAGRAGAPADSGRGNRPPARGRSLLSGRKVPAVLALCVLLGMAAVVASGAFGDIPFMSGETPAPPATPPQPTATIATTTLPAVPIGTPSPGPTAAEPSSLDTLSPVTTPAPQTSPPTASKTPVPLAETRAPQADPPSPAGTSTPSADATQALQADPPTFRVSVTPEDISASPGETIRYTVLIEADENFSESVHMELHVTAGPLFRERHDLGTRGPPYPRTVIYTLKVPDHAPPGIEIQGTLTSTSETLTRENRLSVSIR